MNVSNEILNKPAHLTDEEWKVMKMHPVWGFRYVLKIRHIDDLIMRAAISAFEHHMNYDHHQTDPRFDGLCPLWLLYRLFRQVL